MGVKTEVSCDKCDREYNNVLVKCIDEQGYEFVLCLRCLQSLFDNNTQE